jgi:beta-glucanase (GH16 family)
MRSIVRKLGRYLPAAVSVDRGDLSSHRLMGVVAGQQACPRPLTLSFLCKGGYRRTNRGGMAGIGANSRARQFSAVLALSFLTSMALLMVVNVAASTAGPPPGNWTQTFDEEFNGSSVNTAIWTKGWQTSEEISGPVSSRCFSSAFVSESEGYLHLEVRKQSSTCGGEEQNETGALVESNPTDGVSGHAGFAYSYGYVEWRVYLPGVEETGCPAGGCIANWPALWSFPDDNTETPEIDTMEGLEEWVEEGGKKIAHNGRACFHFHPWPEFGTGACASGYAGWHTFGSDWEPTGMTYYYDGNKVGEIPTPKGNRSTPQYLIMDTAASYSLEPKLFNHAMLVDYVHVYQQLPIVTTGAAAVVTGAASSLTQTSATLNATVNPNGGAVSDCHFEYRTTASYGSSVPCTTLPGAGTSAVAVSAPVTGLAANTTYHFRIVATNPGGTSYSSDQMLTTLPNPPTVATGAASLIAQTVATLSATVNPTGVMVSDCHFEYGTTASYGSSVPCTSLPGSGGSPVAVSAQITGLILNATYHFRIIATNPGGTTYGSDQTLTTLPNPPTVATGAASSLTLTSATLNATVSPDGGTVEECHFDYGTTTSYGSSVPCTALPGAGTSAVAVSAPVKGLITGTAYHFRIVASNAGGTNYGADQALTPVPDAGLASTSLAASLSGRVSVNVTCHAGGSSCTGTVTLRTLTAVSASATSHKSKKPKAAILTLAVGSFEVTGGHATTIKLHLSAKARTLFARTHVLHARATIVARDPAATRTTQTTVTIRAATAKHGHKS